jgi:hypothetical protein
MDAARMMDAISSTHPAARSSSAPAPGRRRSEQNDRFTCLVAACGVVAAGGGGARSATVLLGLGEAGAALAPERLAWLEGRFHVYLEVLDRGSAMTDACVRITRPPDAGPVATRCADAAIRILARAGRRLGRPANG